MSTREIAIYDETFEAVGDLSANQYTGVRFGSTGEVNSGNGTLGIQQNKPAARGEACQVRVHGISRMVVDGSGTPIVRGSPLNGLGVVAPAGNLALATALEPSTTDGDIIAVLLLGAFRVHA